VRRIVFVEVKTSGSDLSARERRVRDAVNARRVEWSELRAGRDTA
jgi:predicted Holliday junction resolvase-like endonuclease